MPQCLIPNCPNNAENNIGIRLRRPDTSAIWAPNSEAYLCDEHAQDGYVINITFSTLPNREIRTNVSATGDVERRTTPIVNNP